MDSVQEHINLSFDNWFTKVNLIIGSRFGIGLDDLPDMDTDGLYEIGYTPLEAANELSAEIEEENEIYSEEG